MCFILKDPHLQYNFDKYETKHSYVICKMFRHFEVCSKYELLKFCYCSTNNLKQVNVHTMIFFIIYYFLILSNRRINN